MDFDLFVIGGGSAGVRCARIAATHGARVGIAEERFWGGTCVNVGCVPKKLMVQAAEYGQWAQDARGFGWTGMVCGEHDWGALVRARDAEVARLSGIYRKLLEGAGARWFEARARLADAHTIVVGNDSVTASRIVIATGGRPVRPALPGAELGDVSDDLFTWPALPRRAVLVGAGYIALEFACLLHGLGAMVDVVFRGDKPLRGFDEDLRDGIVAAMAAQGIRLHPRTMPTALERAGEELRLHTDRGELVADRVLWATGRAPNTEALGLRELGIAMAAGGAVLVDDEHAASPHKHIHAIGDVTDRLNLTPMATAVGHALADTLFGNRPRRASYADVPSAVFTSPPLASVGLTEAEAAARGPANIYLTNFLPMRHTISGNAARRTLMKLVVDAATDRVLGAHLLGEDVPEMMQGIAVAVIAGATKADFDRTIGIPPTAAEEIVTLRTLTRRVG
jgi:glutathione reductase (NADPH)